MNSTLEQREIATIEREPAQLPAARQEVSIMSLISLAVEKDASIEKLQQLMDLQERWEANQARKAFDTAVSMARAEIKPIVKTAVVDFVSKDKTTRTRYSHETLDAIAEEVDPILSKYGLSYRFRSKQEGGLLTVTCVVAHRDGHYEETALAGPPDMSGSKNAYQGVGSAATYLQRYTLKLALGLSAAKDDDAEGTTSGGQQQDQNWAQKPGCISTWQADQLRKALNVAGFSEESFCKHKSISIDALESLPAQRFAGAMKFLQTKAQGAQ
tara:strand:- start:15067 stop:15876 length:810 start_codon:yes stop_codon:yes gene_type:complete